MGSTTFHQHGDDHGGHHDAANSLSWRLLLFKRRHSDGSQVERKRNRKLSSLSQVLRGPVFGNGSQADSISGQKLDDIVQDASDAELCAAECPLAALALAMQISLVLCS